MTQVQAQCLEAHGRRSDVLAMGLFGLAVGALTLGLAQVGAIPDRDYIGALVIALAFGGLVQFFVGIVSTHHHEQLGGIALTTYGLFWITVCMADLVSAGTTFRVSPMLYAELNFVYFVFSAVMVYLTAYRSATLCLLFSVIAATCFLTFLARLDLLTDTLPGIGHIVVGLMALYHAVGSVTYAFTGHELVPLGLPLLPRKARSIQAAP